nr:MAG TPA: hypothetical protein [Bacteriophage sp.]
MFLSKVPHFATLSDGTFFDFYATDFAIIAFYYALRSSCPAERFFSGVLSGAVFVEFNF